MHAHWTAEEDAKLRELVRHYNQDWAMIATFLPGRNRHQVATRWRQCLNPKLTKGRFTKEEDAVIVEWVTEHGGSDWVGLRDILPHRTTKQCRERWMNRLDPQVLRSPWTPQEDQMIAHLHSLWGPKWSKIAEMLPGRTADGVKNRWNFSIAKRIANRRFAIPPSAAPIVAPVPLEEEPELEVVPYRYGWFGEIDDYNSAPVSDVPDV
jgi:hypothetical protein